MKDELRVFENRSDDWLAKQRKAEARVSAWDFDEGHKIKVEHERRHRRYDEEVSKIRSMNKRELDQNTKAKRAITMIGIIWFLIVLVNFIFALIF